MRVPRGQDGSEVQDINLLLSCTNAVMLLLQNNRLTILEYLDTGDVIRDRSGT